MVTSLAEVLDGQTIFFCPLHVFDILQQLGDELGTSSISLMNSVHKSPPVLGGGVRLECEKQPRNPLFECFCGWRRTEEERSRGETPKGEPYDCEVEGSIRGGAAGNAK